MERGTFKLVEECAGEGDLIRNGELLRRVRYQVSRYQGMLEGTGLPVPGLHRIEGSVETADSAFDENLVGAALTLRLEDGRALAITLATADGAVLAEGHGPGRGCSCC